MPQRIFLAAAGALSLALACWILLGSLPAVAEKFFGLGWREGEAVRRICLAGALGIYYLRLLFTWFVFLKRGIHWREVFSVAPWLLCIYLVLAILGGRNMVPLGVWGVFGLIFFVAGSWTNSWSELQRYWWKRQQGNDGKLYQDGLFRYCQHPNYLGDVISYTGLCLIAGSWVSTLLPMITGFGFVFVNIPALNAHLRSRYGAAFMEYERCTAKLIPFVY